MHTLDPEVVEGLVRQIERKDLSTAAHTWRVVLYTRALAERMGVAPDVLERVTIAAALHDLGKLDVPDEILQKPGKLTDAEFEVIKSHSQRGYERLLAMGVDDPIVLNFTRFHHERIDGHGYPLGLKGDEVPPGARYFAVIDTFDALTSVRPYRKEVGEKAAERAIAELRAGIGTRYCQECVDAFEDLYRTGQLDWILTYYNDDAAVPAFRGSVAGARPG